MEVFFHARFFRRVELVPAPLFLAKWLHHAMPSPRGEDAELCSPDAVLPDVTRHGNFISAPLDRCRPQAFSPRRRCRTLFAGCGGSVPSPSSAFRRLPHFQSSMLLHNLSSVFSLGRKASQRARRGSRVPHQRPPRRARPQAHTKPHPAAAQRRPHSPLRQVFHRLSTEFSTFLPVSHSGFLSPWLSWRETASDLLSRGFFLQRKTRYGTVLYGTVRYGAA